MWRDSLETVFSGKKISGIMSIVPEKTYFFDEEIAMYPFPERQTRKIKKIMGFDRHRLSREETTVSDFCVRGLEILFKRKLIKKKDIGALVVVTICPDYFVPHISNIIHGYFELDSDVFCVDIPQACCGFLYGILQSCLLLDCLRDKKVVLINGDVLSHRISKKDRSEYPIAGDATAITIFENSKTEKDIYINICSDGKDRDALIIPAGGFAHPSSKESCIEKVCDDGNIRSDNDLRMNGSKVFDFVSERIPPVFRYTMDKLGLKTEDVDYYLFHQPNKYLLDRLGAELELPNDKYFTNIVGLFGNPHGASIPLSITYNMSDVVKECSKKCFFCGFGAGLDYGTCVMDLGKLEFCEMVEVDL